MGRRRDSQGVVLLDDGEVVEANVAAQSLLDASLTNGTALSELASGLASLLDETPPTAKTVEMGGQLVLARLESLGDTRLLLLTEPTTERRDAILDALPAQCVVLDESGRISFADSAFEELIGREPGTLSDAQLVDHIHPEDTGSVEAAIATLVSEADNDHRFEFRVQNAEGEWRVLEADGRNLLDTPPLSGIVLVCRDVTERKQREHVLKEQNKRLEEFAEIVSHDLRSPLQVAAGHLEQAAATGSEDSFEKVRQAHDRIDTIIGDVLTLAKQGKSVQETQQVSIAEIAEEAWNTVDTKSMALEIEQDKELDADPDRLQQLFENLFRNAAEHAGEDATVTVGPVDPMHTSTRIKEKLPTGFYVADNGDGIPEEDHGSVFDSGFTTESDGTGLGLSIVAQIAEAHQWDPEATDSRDGGARFEFTEKVDGDTLKPE